MGKKDVVGRGLDQLLGEVEEAGIVGSEGLVEIELDLIDPSLHQPRKRMDKKALEELAASVERAGIVQPIVVRKRDERYVLIAGERRLRAAKLAGIEKIPAVVKDVSDMDARKLGLIENIQREDLNPLEVAEAIDALISEYELPQEELAKALGMSRSALANKLRLLSLPRDAKRALLDGEISEGHARAILALPNPSLQKRLLSAIVEKGLSVREAEHWVTLQKSGSASRPRTEPRAFPYQDLIDQLRQRLGTKVSAKGSDVKGMIEIRYFSREELFRIADILLGRG